MEAAAVLGIVSGVVQLVDFCAGVIRESHQLIKSTARTPERLEKLSELQDVDKTLCRKLVADLDVNQPLSEDDAVVYEIIKSLQGHLHSLDGTLDRFTVEPKPDGSKSVIKQVKVAFKARVKRTEIEGLVKDIEAAQQRLGTVVLHLIRKYQVLQHNELFKCMAEYGVNHTELISALKHELLNALSQQLQRLERTEQCLTTLIDKHESVANGQAAINERLGRMSNKQRCEALLGSLRYTGIDDRRNIIADSARHTFDWIFDHESCGFKEWLESDDHLFAIFGKAGSGKSTLMKFISDDQRTRHSLRIWLPTSRLIRTEHYFWYTGEATQKSHDGLLRSLLYGVLSSDLELTSILCPARWQSDDQELRKPWSRRELMESLNNLQFLTAAKVFVLIDGLDEYCPHEKHRLLLDDLAILLKIPNLKLCVASRPWPIFEKAKIFSTSQMFVVEDHTAGDIRQYARDELENAMDDVEDIDTVDTATIDDLADQITGAANGVFLWVYLAVSALSERLRTGLDLEQLRQCLQKLPQDLETYYYDLVYQRISKTWLEGFETAQVLQLAVIMTQFRESRNAWFGSFLNYWQIMQPNGYSDENFAFRQPLTYLCDREITDMAIKTKAFIENCARDLLHVNGGLDLDFEYKYTWPDKIHVDFPHRTVYDFLTTAKMQALLAGFVPRQFHKAEFPGYLHLFHLKFLFSPVSERTLELFSTCMVHVTWHFDDPINADVISEVDDVGSTVVDTVVGTRGLVAWEKFGMVPSALQFLISHNHVKTAVAALKGYLSGGVFPGRVLNMALGRNLVCPFAVENINSELLEVALSRGAGLRGDYNKAWVDFLRSWLWQPRTLGAPPEGAMDFIVQRPRLPEIDQKGWSVAKMLITNGADLFLDCCISHFHEDWHWNTFDPCHRVPVLDILTACVPEDMLKELDDLYASRNLTVESDGETPSRKRQRRRHTWPQMGTILTHRTWSRKSRSARLG